MNSSMSDHLAILEAAETVARIYGDTETAQRLIQLSSEVRHAEEIAEIADGEDGLPPQGPKVR